MAVDPLEMLKEGVRAGERRAMRTYFDALVPGKRPFGPSSS